MYFGIYGNLIAVITAALTGTIFYKSIKPKLGIIYLYVCLSAATQLSINIFYWLGFKRNLAGLHVYMLVEYALITFFYLKYLETIINRKWIYLVSFLFLGYSVTNSLFIQDIWSYPNIPRAIEALILVLFSLLYFYKVLIDVKVEKLKNDPLIWINLAVLFYFSGNFVYHILFNMILEYSRETAKTIGNLFTLLNVIFYILISISFWKAKNSLKQNLIY